MPDETRPTGPGPERVHDLVDRRPAAVEEDA